MLRKTASMVLVLLFILLAAGCGGKGEVKPESNAVPQTGQESGTVTIAYVAMTNGSAQAFINKKYNIFEDALKGKKINYVAAHGLQEVYPLLDKKEGAPDFMYLPQTAFSTYTTETSKYGGSDKYAIIAGSVDSNDVCLVARPEIKSLKDLAGKKVGIANLRYADDYQLNKVLSTVGLGTSTYGGTVEVVWDDIISKLWENYGKGNYAAMVNFDNANNLPKSLAKVPGSKVYSLNPDGMFGKFQPRVWLIAKKELIEKNPDLVKAFLKAHILATEKAVANIDEVAAVNREERIAWYKSRNIYKEEENTLDKFQKAWKNAEPTYDPDMTYVTELFAYMQEKKGLYQGKTSNDIVKINLLNEVLKEMGKPTL